MRLRDYVPALKYGAKILASEVLGINTTGNVYYVIKSTESFYDQFVHDYHTVYADGSDSICADAGNVTSTEATAALNTGIQDALDKCVSSRGDYVVIVPSANDYDIGAVLTMSKKNVHLVAPQNMGWDVGAMNGVRINQVDADASTIYLTSQNCEIAGLYFKPATTYPTITYGNGTSSFANSVHHNSFWWYGTTAYVVGVESGGNDGGSYGLVWNNYFMPAGSSATTTSVVFFENEAPFVRVSGNVCIVGDSNTLSNVFYVKSSKAEVFGNRCAEAGGTITRAITVDTGLGAFNFIGTAANYDVAPAGNTNGFVGNFSGATGGAAASQAQ